MGCQESQALAVCPPVFLSLSARLFPAKRQPAPPQAVDVARLFQEHSPFLLRTVERLTGPGPHVEDIVQEAFLAAHVKRNQLAPDTRWRSWLYSVVLNLIQHHRRSYARRTRLEDAVQQHIPTQHQPGPEELVEQSTNASRVREAMLSIPLEQRAVFALFEFEGLSGGEIANLVGIPVNTVWSRLRLARASFKQALLASRKVGAA